MATPVLVTQQMLGPQSGAFRAFQNSTIGAEPGTVSDLGLPANMRKLASACVVH